MSEQMVTGRRGPTATTAQKTRRLGLVFALVAAAAVSVSGPAKALPPNAPKIGMVCTTSGTHVFNPPCPADVAGDFLWCNPLPPVEVL